MTRTLNLLSLNRKWIIGFGLWLVFLSGILSNIVGTPGILQSIRLNVLLDQQKLNLSALQQEVSRLESEASRLEHNHFAQEKEVRKVLGYAANDELIFDFVPSDQW